MSKEIADLFEQFRREDEKKHLKEMEVLRKQDIEDEKRYIEEKKALQREKRKLEEPFQGPDGEILKQVLDFVNQGKTSVAIADSLNISRSTVTRKRKRLKEMNLL